MKHIKHSLTFSLVLLLHSVANAMDYKTNNYINIDPSQIYYRVGNNVRFFCEYKPYGLRNGMVSFPVYSCDTLPLNIFGNIRYFFTSATQGHAVMPGSPIKVEDPNISDIVVVRGRDDVSGYRFEAYLGYDINNFKNIGSKRIFMAKLFALKTKSTRTVEDIKTSVFDGAIYVTTDQLLHEIKKHLPDTGDCWNCNNRRFINAMCRLLGREWTACKTGINKISFTNDDAVIGNGVCHTTKVYWTQEENRLKDISYQHNKN